jgi:hypothetical protein
MSEQRPRRIYYKFTPEERARWEEARDAALALRPHLADKARRLRDAAGEATFSGALRTAIHEHPKPLPVIASEAGLDINHLDEFLTGDRTLRSDAIDRLTRVLEFQFPPTPLSARPKMELPNVPWQTPPIIDPSNWASMQSPPTA